MIARPGVGAPVLNFAEREDDRLQRIAKALDVARAARHPVDLDAAVNFMDRRALVRVARGEELAGLRDPAEVTIAAVDR